VCIIISPEVSDIKADSRSISGDNKGAIRLVKGCPCYKEFGSGEETVCLNNDDILPINPISLDPTFFTQTGSIEDLKEFKSDKEDMCYLLIYLDKENGKAYCVSQGQKLSINNQDVRDSDIEEALQFVTYTELSSNGALCSECLYKYLVSCTDVGIIPEEDRNAILASYVKKIAIQMAMRLSDAKPSLSGDRFEVHEEIVHKRIKELIEDRTYWISHISELKNRDEDSKLVELYNHYKQLARLESVFLYQVLTIAESSNISVSLGIIKFMVEVAERFINTSDNIRETTYKLEDDGILMSKHIRVILPYSERRKRTERRFHNLIRVLSQVQAASHP
jgi:hypothetical protein